VVITTSILTSQKNITARWKSSEGLSQRTVKLILEMARAANSPVFGLFAKGFETVR